MGIISNRWTFLLSFYGEFNNKINKDIFKLIKGGFILSQLYFRYGTMNCGKSLNLLAVAHNYEEQGKKVLILKSSIDTRSNKGKIESRIGVSHDCIDFSKDDDLYMIIYNQIGEIGNIDCILIDEGQFMTKKQVEDLTYIVDDKDIPIIVYGLKNSYVKGELFEGSKSLLFYTDKIEEIKTICTFCNHKAIMNLRVFNGKPVYVGDPIKVGDVKSNTDFYIPTCREHYFKPDINLEIFN